jgi:hypothetical protein
MMSALFRSEFYTRMKRYWGENISIYRMRKLLFTILKVKLFLKQGISHQLGRGWTQLFDLNARIQQLTWSLIFYEKYTTSQSYLWFWPPLIFFGGFSNFYRYYTRSQMGKSTGYRPTLKPLRMVVRFTTTYAISDYRHWCCEFESLGGELYNIMW